MTGRAVRQEGRQPRAPGDLQTCKFTKMPKPSLSFGERLPGHQGDCGEAESEHGRCPSPGVLVVSDT